MAQLPDNGDHAMVSFPGHRGGRYTLYAYRQFRGQGFPRYTFDPQPLTVDTPRELTGRLIIGCVRHILDHQQILVAIDLQGRVVQIRKLLPRGWTHRQAIRVCAAMSRAAQAEDDRRHRLVQP